MDTSRMDDSFIRLLYYGSIAMITGTIVCIFILPDWIFTQLPLHSFTETMGVFAGLSVAVLLYLQFKHRKNPSYVFISSGLICMGILDGFHGSVYPGQGFVWLHSAAMLAGGFLFAMVWLSDHPVISTKTGFLPVVTAIGTLILAILSVSSRATFPVMVIEGAFTPVAMAMNILGGVFFLLAGLYFWHSRNQATEERRFFTLFCLLSGSAAILFPFSAVWDIEWWLWHFVRNMAYFVLLIYVFMVFRQSEVELREHRERLEGTVKDLEMANGQLANEIAEGKRREEVISMQTREILELSTPVLKVLDGIIVAPLIGTIDSERTQQFMDRFLTSIVQTNSPVGLIDITGVPALDTQTAHHLIEAVTAATLLGTKVIVTGVSPAIAQTLVHLGVDLSDIITKSSLSAGLKVALDYLDLSIAKK